jgi:hypothetical protein
MESARTTAVVDIRAAQVSAMTEFNLVFTDLLLLVWFSVMRLLVLLDDACVTVFRQAHIE